MKMKTQQRPASNKVTIDQLRVQSPSAPIWALNSTSEQIGMSADLHVSIPKANGARTDNLVLPPTWLPINLTDQMPRQQLLDSAEFLRAVNSGSITLITAEFAAELLSQTCVNEERARVNEMNNVQRRLMAGRMHSSDSVEVTVLPDRGDDSTPVKAQFTSNFLAWAGSLATKNDIAALNMLRSRTLSPEEITHLLKNPEIVSEDAKPLCYAALRKLRRKAD